MRNMRILPSAKLQFYIQYPKQINPKRVTPFTIITFYSK